MSATLLSESLTLMPAALPPGSMVGTRTGVHHPSHAWSGQSCFQTQETLTSKWYELCNYNYAQKDGDQGG